MKVRTIYALFNVCVSFPPRTFILTLTSHFPIHFIKNLRQRRYDEGVIKMSLGEKAVLKITSDYGYGARGAPGAIPPNADLTFEVELLAIGNKKAPGFQDGGSCLIL